MLPDEAIRHAVISHSAREAQIRRARVPVKRVENSEEMRFQTFLQRGSDVPVVLGDFFMRQTRRAENLGELVRINSADVRFPFIPAHLDPSGVMGEEVEVQLKAVFAVRFDNAHHLVQVPGLAVRSQRHYLSP